MVSPPSGKEGWLKVGVVSAPILFVYSMMHSPTTSPYGYSSFPKEENGDTNIYVKLTLFSFTLALSASNNPKGKHQIPL